MQHVGQAKTQFLVYLAQVAILGILLIRFKLNIFKHFANYHVDVVKTKPDFLFCVHVIFAEQLVKRLLDWRENK